MYKNITFEFINNYNILISKDYFVNIIIKYFIIPLTT